MNPDFLICFSIIILLLLLLVLLLLLLLLLLLFGKPEYFGGSFHGVILSLF